MAEKSFLRNFLLTPFLKSRGGLGRVDAGALKVAMMVAALDGRILDEEYATFDRLARRCPGATPESIARVFDEGLRAAGYLLLQRARLPLRKFVALFLAEAEAALPSFSALADAESIRRCFATWVAMAAGDGDFSGVERTCLQKLWQRVTQLQGAFAASLAAASAPAAGLPFAADVAALPAASALGDDFLVRVEARLADVGAAAEAVVQDGGVEAKKRYAAAARALEKLVVFGV